MMKGGRQCGERGRRILKIAAVEQRARHRINLGVSSLARILLLAAAQAIRTPCVGRLVPGVDATLLHKSQPSEKSTNRCLKSYHGCAGRERPRVRTLLQKCGFRLTPARTKSTAKK